MIREDCYDVGEIISEWKNSGKETKLRYRMKDDDLCVWNEKRKSCFKHSAVFSTFSSPVLEENIGPDPAT